MKIQENGDGGSSRDAGRATEEMWGRRRLQYLEDNCNGRRCIVTEDGADIEMEAGKKKNQAQEW